MAAQAAKEELDAQKPAARLAAVVSPEIVLGSLPLDTSQQAHRKRPFYSGKKKKRKKNEKNKKQGRELDWI